MSANPVHVGQLQKAGNGAGAQTAVIGASFPVQSSETAATVLAAQAKALVEARFLVALNRPRDIEVARQKILKECRRPGFAKAARYIKPIGKDRNRWPTGPSIRFAEAAIRCMTNIAVETMAVYDDREQRIVRVLVTDLESNIPYSQDVTVRKAVERRFPREGDVILRKRKNSNNDDVYLIEATDDEILNYQNALISKALRTQGLRLIPGDIVDEAMQTCVEIQQDEDAKDPNAAKRAVIDGFGDLGVTADQVREYLGHDLAHLQPKELQDLRALYAALRDGETTWREIMDSRSSRPTKPPLDKFEGKAAPEAEPAATPTKASEPVADKPSNDLHNQDSERDEGRLTFQELVSKLNASKTCEAVQQMIVLIDELPASEQPAIRNIAASKLKRLQERDAPAQNTTAPAQAAATQTTNAAPRRHRAFD